MAMNSMIWSNKDYTSTQIPYVRIPYVRSTSEYSFSTSELWVSARLWQRRLWAQPGILGIPLWETFREPAQRGVPF